MLKQLQHKRFTTLFADRWMRNDNLSLSIYPRYVQANRSIEPTGNMEDSIHKRPDYVHAGI